ncbi:MAG: ABC transporter ATP-binding protein [Bdellovibrionota bacterium]|jgi:phospholipid/cholesterol/gamma-HCH transport system ATP-binding protein
MNESIAIKFENVTMGFRDEIIHEGLSFTISRGESIALLGPSGTGKTVLLKLIVGLLQPRAGQIHVFGNEVSNMSEELLMRVRTQIGFLFQGAALFDSLSVFENIAYPLRQQGADDEKSIHERVTTVLQRVGLESTLQQFPSELSGGQKKRIGLARALAPNPQLLLFDEPTTGLDPTSARQIEDIIENLNNDPEMTTVTITHDISSARRIAQRWMLFAEKTLQADGNAKVLETTNCLIQNFITGTWKRDL